MEQILIHAGRAEMGQETTSGQKRRQKALQPVRTRVEGLFAFFYQSVDRK
jgi:hypothetical protein